MVYQSYPISQTRQVIPQQIPLQQQAGIVHNQEALTTQMLAAAAPQVHLLIKFNIFFNLGTKANSW